MNKKIIKKILIIAILFMILLMAYKLINTYAVFYSEAQAKVKQENATWTIYVNNTNISSQNSNQFNVDTFEIEDNTHVAPGKIAPNTKGKFYIVIDPKETDVSVKYDIKLDKSQLINDKIEISSIAIDGENTLIKTGEDIYTGVIMLDSIKQGRVDKIKVTLEWENDESNNENDTKIGRYVNYKMKIPIEVKATQYLGEKIEEYIPNENTNTQTNTNE